ncbi:hypothetical protein V1281_007657 [Nitrobacteraceae bacterium AZCC 2161]
MDKDIRIETVKATGPTSLRVIWRGKRAAEGVELAGWIATGGSILAALSDPTTFAKASIGDFGSSVTWDDGEGDLAIDAIHLKKLADEQKPFEAGELLGWQARLHLSNVEAADLVGVGLSTWNDYKAGSNVPRPVWILMRVIERDPLLLQAHYRPRKAGRPRKGVAAG